ncbi:hypothetical protein DL98DRAFT_510819 [Cadophora sp. DSE1049]|nr:hypothetical protein DL98DRAFT_510819 [Cadophora sp. DSE1049]
MRCFNAKRQCGGYENEVVGRRPYGAPSTAQVLPSSSTARKCTLPKRVPIPGTNMLPEDTIPTEVTMDESNALALRAFYYDFCVISTNQNLSLGYLSSLEKMVNRLGPKSDLAKVCQAIACASHGKPERRPQFVNRAEASYHHLLGSLAKKLESSTMGNTAEMRLLAMLLGLYQIVMAKANDPGVHEIHASGLATLMKVEHSPLSLLGPLLACKAPGILETQQDVGIFSIPSLKQTNPTLDQLLRSLNLIWKASEGSTNQHDTSKLADECIELDRHFEQWHEDRAPEIRPTTICSVNHDPDAERVTAGYWPGTIDTYFDLYVAGVWNIFRTARLLLLNILLSTPDKYGNLAQFVKTANHIVEDIFASIPYHLADNLPVFVDGIGRKETIDPGRTLGGLLLMYPLYAVSTLTFLCDKTREYTRACLQWIGEEMGIGQAGLMANAELDRGYLESGCMIIWSGFLG